MKDFQETTARLQPTTPFKGSVTGEEPTTTTIGLNDFHSEDTVDARGTGGGGMYVTAENKKMGSLFSSATLGLGSPELEYSLIGDTPPNTANIAGKGVDQSAATTFTPPRMLYGSPEGANMDLIEMLTATKPPPPRSVGFAPPGQASPSLSISPAFALVEPGSQTADRGRGSNPLISRISLSTSHSTPTSPAHTHAQSSPHKHTARPVRVAVRVRPFTSLEIDQGARRVVSFNGNKLIIVNPTAFDADPDAIAVAAAAVQAKEWAQVFKFDHVLWSHDAAGDDDDDGRHVSQEGVHREIGCEIVEKVLSGVSASCFAYGHTGTGKTHSLFGKLVSPSIAKVPTAPQTPLSTHTLPHTHSTSSPHASSPSPRSHSHPPSDIKLTYPCHLHSVHPASPLLGPCPPPWTLPGGEPFRRPRLPAQASTRRLRHRAALPHLPQRRLRAHPAPAQRPARRGAAAVRGR